MISEMGPTGQQCLGLFPPKKVVVLDAAAMTMSHHLKRNAIPVAEQWATADKGMLPMGHVSSLERPVAFNRHEML